MAERPDAVQTRSGACSGGETRQTSHFGPGMVCQAEGWQ